MIKKLILILIVLYNIVLFAQDNTQKIIDIQSYIQETSQSAWFDPINKTGNLEDGTSYDLSYYTLNENDLFSVIYTTFGKITLRKVYYYKNNVVIASIVEETDANNANKLLNYADYFYENAQLINVNEMKNEFLPTEIYNEGMLHYNNLKQIISTQP
jgi:hypothetical protein